MTRIPSALVTAALLACSMVASAEPKKPADKTAETPPLPPAPARLWLMAEAPTGPWTLRIENEGTVALRVPADIRLLQLEVQTTDEKAKPVACAAPTALRTANFPEDRALLLAPGQTYEESFDPRLFCFGNNATALATNSIVRARFGWDPPKPNDKKPPKSPFAAESTELEPTVAPLKELRAPSILLGAAPAPKPMEKAPAEEETNSEAESKPAATTPVDERAGRLELSSSGFVDAAAPRSVTINVTAKNAGMRPIVVALRPWMLSFNIEGPQGYEQTCYADASRRALPRDAFRTLAPGASTSFAVLLAEVCPKNTFPRPGLYRVTPTLSANETMAGVEAYTAEVTVAEPTLIRLATGKDPFYAQPPKATTPATPDEESEE